MPWHTDNNLLSRGRVVGRHGLAGLQFVLYLSDASFAPFQVLQDSQNWSSNHPEQYLGEQDVDSLYRDKVVTIEPDAGDLVILNTHVFHRGMPFRRNNCSRSVLLYQFDCISDKHPGLGESLLVNPAFLSNFTPDIASILGFGISRDDPPFPMTSEENLSHKDLWKLQSLLRKKWLGSLLVGLAKRLLPERVALRIRNYKIARAKASSFKEGLTSIGS